MNRNQLKYFVAAAETRSFTKAAEQYYISQTAVTQQIHLLEETLGCALFDRSTRPVSLTPAGKAFLLDAKAILERMSRAAERVHDASTGLSGTLRVGYVRGYERSDLSILMRRFHQQNGNVLITSTATGHIFEVTQDKRVVWEYVSPFMSEGRAKAVLTEDDATADPDGVKDINLTANVVHRAFRYAPDHPGLAGRDLSRKTEVFPGAPKWHELFARAAGLTSPLNDR